MVYKCSLACKLRKFDHQLQTIVFHKSKIFPPPPLPFPSPHPSFNLTFASFFLLPTSLMITFMK